MTTPVPRSIDRSGRAFLAPSRQILAERTPLDTTIGPAEGPSDFLVDRRLRHARHPTTPPVGVRRARRTRPGGAPTHPRPAEMPSDTGLWRSWGTAAGAPVTDSARGPPGRINRPGKALTPSRRARSTVRDGPASARSGRRRGTTRAAGAQTRQHASDQPHPFRGGLRGPGRRAAGPAGARAGARTRLPLHARERAHVPRLAAYLALAARGRCRGRPAPPRVRGARDEGHRGRTPRRTGRRHRRRRGAALARCGVRDPARPPLPAQRMPWVLAGGLIVLALFGLVLIAMRGVA